MAYYAEKDFFQDQAAFKAGERFSEGKLGLEWMDADTENVRCTMSNPRRGLTYEDCNVGSYGYSAMPEFVRHNYSMAARGSMLVPGLPDLGYTENRKSEVWSENVAFLYEEAKSRRWVPAREIEWGLVQAEPLPHECNLAMRQLCTTLEEIALVAMEFPARWVSIINQEFLELKSFLCAQMLDEARHVEAFRKRALSTGGLKRASASVEQALKELLLADTYTEGSLGMNVLVGSLLLGVYGLAAQSSRLDAILFRLCMQDTARTVAYGVGQLRYCTRLQPSREIALQDYLDRCEHTFVGLACSPELLEPLIVLCGGGTAKEEIRRGIDRVKATWRMTIAAYLARLGAAGLERRERSRLTTFFAD